MVLSLSGPSRPGEAGLLLLLLASLALHLAAADYDSDLCDKYAGSAADTSITPYFYDDYEAITEETVYSKDGSTQGKIVQRNMRYSASHKQLEIRDTLLYNSDYYFVDTKANDCLHDDLSPMDNCKRGKDVCLDMEKDLGLFDVIDDKVSLTASGKTLFWSEKNFKKKVTKGSSSNRDMKTNLVVTCAYDANKDITTVSEWHVLDVDKYSNLDSNKAIVVMAHHHRSKDGDAMESRRIDYFDYRKLSLNDLQYGLQIDEKMCRNVDRSKKPLPSFPSRFSYAQEVDTSTEYICTGTKCTRSFQEIEFNLMSQIIRTTDYNGINDENEKEKSFKYIDYSTRHTYLVSETTGSCTIDPKSADYGSMLSSKQFWGMKNVIHSYVRNYRDIPCNYYYSWDKNTSPAFTLLCLANSDWLKSQGRSEKDFYPVFMESFDSKNYKHMHIYEYRENPGYHYPYFRDCYDENTNADIDFSVAVLYDSVKDSLVEFEYEMRTLIKKITGIVASARIQGFHFYKDYTTPQDTRVSLSIFGDSKQFNRSSSQAFYASDPVTSQMAVEKMKKAVDSGSLAFKLDKKQKDVHFKKGSFMHFSYNYRYPAVSGHSSGAMAGIGIGMIFVGLAFGLGALFGYKRWNQGSMPALSFSLGKNGVKDVV